ncbi:hypothetical protein ACVBEH_06780 [Roseateles sp. GG27B]
MNRGLALSLLLCGTGASAALQPSVAELGDCPLGLAGRLFDLAALPLLMWLSLCWRRRLPGLSVAGTQTTTATSINTAAAKSGMPFTQALHDRRFWVCNIGLGLVVSAICGMATNTVPLLCDIGLAAAHAGAIFGTFGVALIIGRICMDSLIDRLWDPAWRPSRWPCPPPVACRFWVPTPARRR